MRLGFRAANARRRILHQSGVKVQWIGDDYMADEAQKQMIEAGLLPEVMPNNFTFRKVREILSQLENTDSGKVHEAINAAKGLKIRGPLASVIFIRHHLDGQHEVEVDRLEESEEGIRFAVLVYSEGEVPIQVEFLPEGISNGSQLRYDPSEERYC